MRSLFSPAVIVGALLVGCLLFAAAAGLVYATRPAPEPKGAATAVVYVLAAPTPTAVLPTPTPEPTPTATSPVPAPPPGMIAVGAYVQITGTGGDGLRLRADPGLNGEIRLLGIEAEVFQVIDGPRDADGYTWWQLVAPADERRKGWAVANYLAVIQNP